MAARKFLKACRSGSAEDIRTLLNDVSQSHQLRTKADESALHVVITYNPNPAPIVDLLLQNNHDPNMRGHRNQNRAPLHEAACRGYLGTVKILLDAGANVDCIKSGDWTPLMMACANGFESVASLLLEAGASAEAANRHGENSLHLAARQSVACVRLVIEKGAEPRSRTRNGRTPLHYASRAGKVDCARHLIASGAMTEDTDKCGMNALHEACIGGYAAMVQEYLCTAPHVSLEADCGGLTPLHHAAICGYGEITQLLIQNEQGRKTIDIKDNRGHAPLQLALLNGHQGVANALISNGEKT